MAGCLAFDEEPIDKHLAVDAIWALWRELPTGTGDICIPGVPGDDAEFNAFDNWTAGVLRRVIALYAEAASVDQNGFVTQCVKSTRVAYRWHTRLELEQHKRALLDPDALAKVARYEANPERSLTRHSHELQRIQASRRGIKVPPPSAVDIELNLNAGSRGSDSGSRYRNQRS